MSNWVNFITYGNPSDDILPYLNKGEFDFVYEQLKDYPFPENASETTKDEIRELIQYQNSPEQRNTEIIERFIAYDSNPIRFLDDYAKNTIGHDMGKEIESVVNDGAYILFKLKFFYQRPRPNQLAQYFKARLFPYATQSGHTPSYPSGHAFEAFLVAEYIGSKHPEHYQFLIELANDISISRLYLGLHYATDLDFGKYVAKKMVSTKEFASKYGI